MQKRAFCGIRIYPCAPIAPNLRPSHGWEGASKTGFTCPFPDRGAAPVGLAFGASPKRSWGMQPSLFFAVADRSSSRRGGQALRFRYCPGLKDSALHPPRRGGRPSAFCPGGLLRPLLTCPCRFRRLSPPIAPASRRVRAGVEISHGKSTCPWLRTRRIYRRGIRMSMGVSVHGPMTHAATALYPVSVRRV